MRQVHAFFLPSRPGSSNLFLGLINASAPLAPLGTTKSSNVNFGLWSTAQWDRSSIDGLACQAWIVGERCFFRVISDSFDVRYALKYVRDFVSFHSLGVVELDADLHVYSL